MMKCVIVIDEKLPVGLQANTAAALGLSLGNHVEGLIGPDVMDANGLIYKGITAIPLPILAASQSEVNELFKIAMSKSETLIVLGFNTTAQSYNSYEKYADKMKQMPSNTLTFLGVCIYGPKKIVNQLCGQMKLLR